MIEFESWLQMMLAMPLGFGMVVCIPSFTTFIYAFIIKLGYQAIWKEELDDDTSMVIGFIISLFTGVFLFKKVMYFFFIHADTINYLFSWLPNINPNGTGGIILFVIGIVGLIGILLWACIDQEIEYRERMKKYR